MRQILNEVEQNAHLLEIRSDDPDVIHNQLENCLVSCIFQISLPYSFYSIETLQNFIGYQNRSGICYSHRTWDC
jgi:hypothetical protein